MALEEELRDYIDSQLSYSLPLRLCRVLNFNQNTLLYHVEDYYNNLLYWYDVVGKSHEDDDVMVPDYPINSLVLVCFLDKSMDKNIFIVGGVNF